MAQPTTLPFDWADPFALDAQLSDEERIVRDTAEAYAQEKLQPRVTARLSRGEVRPRDHGRDGRARPARRDDRPRIWRRRAQLCELRPRRARGRAGRQRLSLGHVGPVLARHAPDPRLRVARRRGANICPGSRPANGSAASASPSRTPAPIPARCAPARRRSTAAIGSPAPRCGSPMRRSPTSSSSGRSRTRMTARITRLHPRKGHGRACRRRRSGRSCRSAPRSPARS